MQLLFKYMNAKAFLSQSRGLKWINTFDLKIGNLDKVSIAAKIVANFDFAHLILWNSYGV